MVKLIDEFEASELLRLTPRQVLGLARRGLLPAVHLPGREIRFDPADLAAWIESHKRGEPQCDGVRAADDRRSAP
jgi:excisionase family DNA binding protein